MLYRNIGELRDMGHIFADDSVFRLTDAGRIARL